jgi:hypothetical protein
VLGNSQTYLGSNILSMKKPIAGSEEKKGALVLLMGLFAEVKK